MSNDNIKYVDAMIGNPKYISEQLPKLSASLTLSEMNYQFERSSIVEGKIRDFYKYVINMPLTQTDRIIWGNGIPATYMAVLYSIYKRLGNNRLWIDHASQIPSYILLYEAASTSSNYHYTFSKPDNLYFNDDLPTEWNYNDLSYNNYYKTNPDVFVAISPNNPTGEYANIDTITQRARSSIENKKNSFWLIDEVYNVPIFNINKFTEQPIKKYINPNNLILFDSISKFGIPSARFGWCIINNPILDDDIWKYIKFNNKGTNQISFEYFNAYADFYKNNISICKDIANTLYNRKLSIKNIINKNLIIDNRNEVPFLMTKIPTEYFKKRNIIARDGLEFGLKSGMYSRLNLMLYKYEWDLLMKYLKY